MKQCVSTLTIALLIVLSISGICMAETNDEHGTSFSAHSLIKPLGIATLCCMICTFVVGLFRKRLRAKFIGIHVPLAIISVILGLTHGLLIIVLYGL